MLNKTYGFRFTTRASESNGEDGNNVPLIAEILKLRAESSKILSKYRA